MKRVLTLVLVLALCFTLTACFGFGFGMDEPTKEVASGEPAEDVKGDKANDADAQQKEETFGMNEAAVFDDLKFTATDLEESEGSEYNKPEDGNVFVGVKFEIENISDEEHSISSVLLFNAYVDDVQCDDSFSADLAFDKTLDGELAPGKKMIGYYSLEVPKDWKKIELDVQSSWLSASSARFLFEK